MTDTTAIKSRRRSPKKSPETTTQNNNNSGDYYDPDDDGKDHASNAYKDACGVGKFVLNPCLCLATTAGICCRNCAGAVAAVRGKRRQQQSRQLPFYQQAFAPNNRNHNSRLIQTSIYVCVSLSLLWLGWRTVVVGWSRQSRLDRLPILIKRFDYSNFDDIGGWMYPSKPFPSISRLPPIVEMKDRKPDYGDILYYTSVSSPGTPFRREIDPNDYKKYEVERDVLLKIYDKDKHLEDDYEPDDDLDPNDKCKRTSWKSSYYPVCNNFHEFDLSRSHDPDIKKDPETLDYDVYYFNHGYYRDVWSITSSTHQEGMVLKQLRWKYNTGIHYFTNVQKDAIIMERLTRSPRIINIYGHCFTSVTVEPIAYEVEEYIVPGSGYIDPKELNDSQDVNPQNDYTPMEKLEMALEMAESLADLHGYEGGVIVHDDVQLCQWLRTRDDKLVLGDFNRAEIMDWNEEKREYCRYRNGEGYGNYRSPEEFADRKLNEKIDVYSFGNNIYALLTGLWVFYDNEDDQLVQKKIIKGEKAFIDERYRTRSFGERKLVEIMEKCWEYDPDQRIDIFEIIKFLRQAIKENTPG